MKLAILWLVLAGIPLMEAEGQTSLRFPATVKAGTAFSVSTVGVGPASLYIAGPGGILRRKVQLGETVSFAANDLQVAGHYVAFLLQGATPESVEFDVEPARQVAAVSFLAKPSRIAVNVPNGLSAVTYVFDVFHNLILESQQVSFRITDASGRVESRSATTQSGVAWVRMNSAARAGVAQFEAVAGNIRENRVVQQVPGDPCAIRMAAHQSGGRVALETEAVRDCNGNPVPDGTIVTFTESHPGGQSTVDVPLKRGIARTEMPAIPGAVISVATGVVMGNEIHWGGGL
jgi:hypothetical protein